MEARVVVRGQTGAQCQMMMMKVMRRLMLWRRWQCSTESPTSSTYWPQFPFSLLQFHSPWSSFLIWLAYSPHHHPILSSSHSFIPPILLKTTLASVCVCVCVSVCTCLESWTWSSYTHTYWRTHCVHSSPFYLFNVRLQHHHHHHHHQQQQQQQQ